MKKRSRAGVVVITSICLSLGFGSWSYTRTHLSVPNPVQKGTAMAMHASGTFEVKLLTAGTDVKGSAGYVAIERVTGMLQGRTGSFVLQHSGTLTRGAPQQSITVVPDSGTGQLAGLTGKMTINIVDGKHSYDIRLHLPEAPDNFPSGAMATCGTASVRIHR